MVAKKQSGKKRAIQKQSRPDRIGEKWDWWQKEEGLRSEEEVLRMQVIFSSSELMLWQHLWC